QQTDNALSGFSAEDQTGWPPLGGSSCLAPGPCRPERALYTQALDTGCRPVALPSQCSGPLVPRTGVDACRCGRALISPPADVSWELECEGDRRQAGLASA